MARVRTFTPCVLRSRCPCCHQGPLFAGWLAFHPRCPSCGLEYEQWYGDWITPTYLAGTVGALAAAGMVAWAFARGDGADSPLANRWLIGAVSCGVALIALRPAKAAWLALLYRLGGVEVSAETRARLRWAEPEVRDASWRARAETAEERARRAPPPADRAGRGRQPDVPRNAAHGSP